MKAARAYGMDARGFCFEPEALRAVYLLRLQGKMAVVSDATFIWKVLHLPMSFFSQRAAGDIMARYDTNADIAEEVVGTLAPLIVNLGMLVVCLIIMVTYSPLLAAIGVVSVVANLAAARVSLHNVTFGYAPLADPVIADFSVDIEPGGSVAFVGASGCGKSTLAKLISGMYQPWAGEVLLDGKPAGSIPREIRAGSLAVIDQDIVLFNDSIMSNIKLWDASIEDYEVLMAARDARIHDAIMQRDEGYEHVLAEGGRDFSGGERQRMEIARALAQDPTVLIVVTAGLNLVTVLVRMRVSRRLLKHGAEVTGWTYALVSGIQKVKVAGAEKRAFATWAQRYVEQARLMYNGPLFLRLSGTLQLLVSLLGTIVIYAAAVAGGVGVAEYMAFSVAYGMVSGSFMALASMGAAVATIKPNLEMAEPLLSITPEQGEARRAVTQISGSIELDSVTFGYGAHEPLFSDLSLKIKRGQYVAIASRPKILMFDEATSALDNITQRIVCESLDKLKCTRIVIAHRLSTIQSCDRIVVLDEGRIVEDGSYDELVAHEGAFAELVYRQRV